MYPKIVEEQFMPDRKQALFLYEKMVRMRKFEEGVVSVYEEGLSPGSPHLYIGQEAIAAGVCSVLRADDYILPSHRGHGQIIGKGADMRRVMAELLGKKTGYCQGKGGSMHMAILELGCLGSVGIVGSNLVLAVGVGHACQFYNKGQIVACFFGDGASNRGTFHEGLNMASIRKLPIIYVLENNFFGISGDQRKLTNVTDLSIRSVAYNIPGETIDGNDVFACLAATEKAASRARNGDGPTILEFKTWRHLGHWQGDPDYKSFIYRKRDEHELWMKRDPILLLRNRILAEGWGNQKDLESIDSNANREVKEAIQFAIDSPWPEISQTTTDVYVDWEDR
jgi:TPP-dependent pyruvate/acetoin dehydrogenase alpha subunit